MFDSWKQDVLKTGVDPSIQQFLEKAWDHHVNSKLSRFYSNISSDFDGFLKAVANLSIDSSEEPKFELYIKVAVNSRDAIQDLSKVQNVTAEILDRFKDVVAPMLDLEVTLISNCNRKAILLQIKKSLEISLVIGNRSILKIWTT